ncbi:UNVERIFIED_CONTAM: hypothetical protein K2H54_037594 [Gekko kuhli]
MDLKTFPRLETLSSFRGHKSRKNIPLAQDSRFSIDKTHVKNLAEFGPAIEQLCRGIPTYYAYQEQGRKHFSSIAEAAANVWEQVKVTNPRIIITCGLKSAGKGGGSALPVSLNSALAGEHQQIILHVSVHLVRMAP